MINPCLEFYALTGFNVSNEIAVNHHLTAGNLLSVIRQKVLCIHIKSPKENGAPKAPQNVFKDAVYFVVSVSQ